MKIAPITQAQRASFGALAVLAVASLLFDESSLMLLTASAVSAALAWYVLHISRPAKAPMSLVEGPVSVEPADHVQIERQLVQQLVDRGLEVTSDYLILRGRIDAHTYFDDEQWDQVHEWTRLLMQQADICLRSTILRGRGQELHQVLNSASEQILTCNVDDLPDMDALAPLTAALREAC